MPGPCSSSRTSDSSRIPVGPCICFGCSVASSGSGVATEVAALGCPALSDAVASGESRTSYCLIDPSIASSRPLTPKSLSPLKKRRQEDGESGGMGSGNRSLVTDKGCARQGELPMRAGTAAEFFDAGYPARALALMSSLLDEHPEFLEWIAADVDRGVVSSVGRRGLPCEVILRCGILKHLWQSDYRELEFSWSSVSARRFTRVDASALQRCIGAVRAEVSGSTGSCWAGPATTSSGGPHGAHR